MGRRRSRLAHGLAIHPEIKGTKTHWLPLAQQSANFPVGDEAKRLNREVGMATPTPRIIWLKTWTQEINEGYITPLIAEYGRAQ